MHTLSLHDALPISKNTDGLAAVMGHEIAHAVAKHSVERASANVAINVVTSVTDLLTGGKISTVNRSTGTNTVGLLTQVGILNPFNRKQESEENIQSSNIDDSENAPEKTNQEVEESKETQE